MYFNVLKHCNNKCISIIVYLLVVLIFSNGVLAENKILINEFLIDPQPQQVEIINTATESTDISGWYIDDNGGTAYYTIPQSSILYPNSCLVFSGDFNLNKSSADTVRLFDTTASPTSSNANLIDSFSYKSSSGSGITYLRLPDGSNNWSTGSATLGKFNSTNVSCIIGPSPTPILTPTSTPSETPSPTPVSYSNIFISEVMANPSSGENEWIELFNNNDFSVSLTNWFIDDIENAGSSPKLFSLDIPPKSYGLMTLSSSMFNNTGDNVRLLDFNKNLIDSFEYSATTQGKTLGRTSYDSDEFCLQEPSKGSLNNSCINSSPTPQPTLAKVSTPAPTKLFAAVSQTKTPTKPISINQLIDTNNNLTPIIRIIGDGEVLGLSDQNSINSHNLLIRSLSFVSFSYSLLTILSIFLKMKNSYEKGL